MNLPDQPEPSLLRHRRSSEAPKAEPTNTSAPNSTLKTQAWLKRALVAAAALTLVLLLLAFTAAIALRHDLHASLPQLDGNLPVPGLSAPVTITRDPHGVPSIHASTLDDLLFAQGYITASDRLFQMDALRRHGAGELAEILGPSLLDHDREQRILQLRSAADRAIAILPPDQLHQLQAYANGVNAFITSHSHTGNTHQPSPSAHDSAQGQDLPVEFHLLRYTPAPWTPRDSLLIAIIMSQDLSTSFPTKLNREALSAHLPASLLPDLYPVGSWRDQPPTQTPADLTAPSTPIEQIPLDKTQSSLRNPDPTPALRAGAGCPIHGAVSSRHGWDANAGCPTASPHDLLQISTDLRPRFCDGCLPGSNNWAVSGAHTASGAPLLSNDMHLSLTAPDLWYEAALHLESCADGGCTSSDHTTSNATPNPPPAVRAGLNVTGFTLPGVPFIIVGRNAFVAWGFTNSGADVQDVLIEHLRGSGTHTEFEHPDHTWSLVAHHTEHIRVRFGRDLNLDVLSTTHTLGSTTITTPIISPLYKSEHRALALAWTIYDPSTITSPMYAINTATDAASLVAACAGFGSVSQNLVYADAHHIGYHLLGRIPIRGPATQRPRAVQPFILPDTTPSEDEDDESGDPQISTLTQPSLQNPGAPHLASELWVSKPRPAFVLASTTPNTVILSGAQHSRRTPTKPVAPIPSAPSASQSPQDLAPSPQNLAPSPQNLAPSPQNLAPSPQNLYTIGSPISPIPIDALDTTQTWSGYIPYDALPSVLDPPSGLLATANSRITTDQYPYFITNNWIDAYRVERIQHLLSADIVDHTHLTSADMLAIQTDTHSEFDLLLAHRLAYALDHSPLTSKDRRLQQAANLLRSWNGDVSATSSAAAIVASTRGALWPMLLAPKLRGQSRSQSQGTARSRATTHSKPSPSAQDPSAHDIDDLLHLYSWDEKNSALELILQHTPARWLPHNFPNWDDFLATALQRALRLDHAPSDLSTWTYGPLHPVDIAHPVFGSHSPISTLLGVPTGSGFHPNGGDNTTIKQTGLHFGPSERFTADLSNPDNTHANITTGESGNPSSPWFLDQFLPWLNGTTFTLPLDNPQTTHTLTLTPPTP